MGKVMDGRAGVALLRVSLAVESESALKEVTDALDITVEVPFGIEVVSRHHLREVNHRGLVVLTTHT